MQPPSDSGFPKAAPLRINLAQERIGWRKHRPLFLAVRENVVLAIMLVVYIPFLPVIGSLYMIRMYKSYRHKVAVKNGIMPNELSASKKTTVCLSGHDVERILGRTDIEYSQSPEKASFNYQYGNGRYKVYGTSRDGLFMLVPLHSKIDPEESKDGTYYHCDVVCVKGGYNHGDFGETLMGSSDCVVLVCKKTSKFPPFKGLIVITAKADYFVQRHVI